MIIFTKSVIQHMTLRNLSGIITEIRSKVKGFWQLYSVFWEIDSLPEPLRVAWGEGVKFQSSSRHTMILAKNKY